jgi:hypothetical protein
MVSMTQWSAERFSVSLFQLRGNNVNFREQLRKWTQRIFDRTAPLEPWVFEIRLTKLKIELLTFINRSCSEVFYGPSQCVREDV